MPTMLKVTSRLNTEQHLQTSPPSQPETGLTHHAAGAQHEVPPQKEPLPAIFFVSLEPSGRSQKSQKVAFWRGQPF